MTDLVSPQDQKKEQMFERKNQKTPDSVGGPTTGFLDRVQQSFAQAWDVGNINSRMRVKNNLYARLKTKAESELGEKVPHPLNPEYELKDPDLITRFGRFSGGIPLVDTGIPVADQKDVDSFFKKMQEAYEKTGDEAFNINREKFENIVSSHQADVDKETKQTRMRFGGNAASGFAADLIGSMPAILADPWDIGTLPIGAAASTKVLGSKVLGTALTEAGIEGTVELLQQPDVQNLREKAGLETSISQVAFNTLSASTGAAGLGSATRAIGLKVDDYLKALDNQKKAKEVTKALSKRGTSITEVDTARRVLEMNDYMRRTNPFDDSAYGKEVSNLGVHLTNIKKAQEGIVEGKSVDIDNTPNGKQVPNINRNTEPVPVEKIDTTNRATNLDEPDESVRPIFWEDESGNLKLIEGTDQVATGMQKGLDEVKATVLKASKGVDEEMAERFVAGKRFEEGRITREELAEVMGKDPDSTLTPKRSQFVQDGKAIRDNLSDEAFIKLKTDKNVDFHVAGEVARNVKDTNQIKALELTKKAQTKSEAKMIIDQAKNKGFNKVDPVEEISKRNRVLNESLSKMKSEDLDLTYPDGTEVKVDDEFLAGLQRLSRSDSELSKALNRQSKAIGQDQGPETLESAADEFLSSVQEKIRSGNISRDAIRKTGGTEGFRAEGQRAIDQRNFRQDVERPEIEEQIKNRELPEIEEFRQTIEEEGLEEMRIPSLKEDEDLMTVKEALEVVEEDKKALNELRDCAV